MREEQLVPEPELLDERPIGRQIAPLEVREQPAAGADHLQQPAAAVMILQMGAEVLGKRIDPLSEERHLHLGGAGIGGVRLVLTDDCLLIEAHASDPLNVVSVS